MIPKFPFFAHTVSPNEDTESNLKQIIQNIPVLTEIFKIQDKVGEGTFSKVYRACHLTTGEFYALKCIIPTIKPSRIIPELRYLRDMGGDSNVIEIKTCLFGGGFTVLVMPFFQHDRFSDFFNDMNVMEIKDYMRALLVALRKVHSNGVIHRDVKPNNFLYNRREKRYALVDFGLAQNELELLKGWKATSAQHPACNRTKSTSLVDTSTQRITANQLLAKQESKLVCVRKRLLQEDTNQGQAKRCKFDSVQQCTAFGTPLTSRPKGLQNMTNLLTPNTSMDNCVNTLPMVPELAPLPLLQPRTLMSTPVKQMLTLRKNGHEIDPFKTPTKRDKENYFGQIVPSSPGLQIIPETPPKSAKGPSALATCGNKLPMPAFRNLRESPFRHLTTTLIGPAAKGSAVTSNIFNKDTFAGQATPVRGCQQQSAATTSATGSATKTALCGCYGTEQICRICIKRTDLNAPRAGTPGFRAPEVLLKKMDQTSAIDIWSAGVIFAALLSRRYPFFSSTDDLTSLAEIISLFGTKRVSNAAFAIGRTIVTSAKHQPALNLKDVCLKLRNDCAQIDDSAFDLLDKLLDPNPNSRITAADALNHPFLHNPYLL